MTEFGEQNADGPAGPRRTGRLLIAGLVALVLVSAVATSVALLSRDDVSGVGSVTLPEPHTIKRGGVEYRIGLATPVAAVSAAADSRAVIVYAADIEGSEDPRCSFLAPLARIVGETTDRVRIATFDYSLPAQAGATRACGYLTDAGDSMYRAMPLQLKRPWDGRRLIDVRTGKEIGVLDRDYTPEPAYVPAGYGHPETSHYTPESSFVATRSYHDATSSIEVRMRSATAWSRSGKVLGKDEIAGAAATITEESYQRCVSWSPRGGLIAEVCSLGLTTAKAEYLPAAELLRIARSVSPPER